jgi:DnaK suppressor protein
MRKGDNKKEAKETKEAPVPAAPAASVPVGGVTVPPNYDPEKDKGKFMNPVMLEYFRRSLIAWRTELLRESQETIKNTLQETELQKPDLADRASAETDHALELRTRDRERKLISKITSALERIDAGEYGFCEETGEPITIARLKARPVATLSVEAQERHERMEKTQRDD